jgi:hypothetical protein
VPLNQPMRPSLASLSLHTRAPFELGPVFHAEAPVASYLSFSAARAPPPTGYAFHLTMRGVEINASRTGLGQPRAS